MQAALTAQPAGLSSVAFDNEYYHLALMLGGGLGAGDCKLRNGPASIEQQLHLLMRRRLLHTACAASKETCRGGAQSCLPGGHWRAQGTRALASKGGEHGCA